MAVNFYVKIDGGWGIGFTLYEYFLTIKMMVKIKKPIIILFGNK